jgi:very-short-patch-repair endonuclease
VDSPFHGTEAIASGRLSKDALRTAAWRRLFRDVYVASDVEPTHLVRCRAAVLVLPAIAAISGGSAAYLHGCDVLDADAPVDVTVTRQIRPRTGMRVRRASLDPSDIVRLAGMPVTALARTAFDVARSAELDDAVVTVDSLLNLGRVSLEEARAYAEHRATWRGTARARRVLALAAQGAESPMETRLRLLLVRAGLPTPVLQLRLEDGRGLAVARLDLAYETQRLSIEYDGEHHFEAPAVRKDVRRQNMVRSLGWSLLRFNSDDVLHHPARLVAEVRAALAR